MKNGFEKDDNTFMTDHERTREPGNSGRPNLEADLEGGRAQGEDKLTTWVNEPSTLTLGHDLTAAQSSHDAMVTKVKEWVDTLNIKRPERNPNARTSTRTRSKVQPKLVRKQAEWRYSALTESFLSSDKMFTISPATWKDTKAAEQNEILINWQFRTKMRRVKFIDEYVRTTYDEGTAFVKVGWQRVTKMVKKTVPVYSYRVAADEQALSLLDQAIQMAETDPTGFEKDVPEELKAALAYMEANPDVGPVIAIDTGTTQEVEEEEVLVNQPTVEILNYQNIYFDPSCLGDLSKANYFILSFETSKAELMKDGRYKNLDKINWSSQTVGSTPNHDTTTPNHTQFRDDLRKRVVAYEYWGFYDIHGTGELVPIVATWIGKHMIRMEENPYPDGEIPVVAVPYMPVTRSVTGETDAYLLKDNQDIIGALSRGLIDSMGRTANGQRGIQKQLLDPANRRKFEEGEDYEFNPNVQDIRAGVIEHKFGEISQSAIAMLELQNNEAESLTGVKSYAGGMSGEAYGKVAAGIRGMLDASSKREMAILRRMADGLVQIGQKIAAMNGAFLSEQEVVRVTDTQFITIHREDLKGNFDFKVDISTPEVDEAKSQDLGFMLQTNGNNMDPEMRNILWARIATLKRMPDLAHSILNFKPTPDPLVEKAKELEIAKLELEVAKLRAEAAELDTQAALNRAKVTETMAKARLADSQADMTDLDYVETETGTKHAREKDKIGQQAESNQNLEVTKALLAKKKEGEKDGNLSAAVGWNRVSAAQSDVR